MKFSVDGSEEWMYERVYICASSVEEAMVLGQEVLERLKAIMRGKSDTREVADEVEIAGLLVLGELIGAIGGPKSLEEAAEKMAKRALRLEQRS